MRPIVALLTDFGSQDHYVGAVKGAVLAACREAALVDIAHDLSPHDIAAGAYALAACYRAFPGGSVFLAVVDPGVGSGRRALALEAGGYTFVGPDNGLFTLVLDEQPGARLHEITNAGLYRHELSATFHARDIFGPVAGLLAGGLPIGDVGAPARDPVRLPAAPVRRRAEGDWEAMVIHVDRFGNLTTNLSSGELSAILLSVDGDPRQLLAVVEGIVLPLATTYADVPHGEACALVGSSGRLEISVNCGSAARLLGAGRGARVLIRRAVSPVL